MVIPLPGLGIDRFADRSKQAKTLARRAGHGIVTLAHESADRRRCRVNNIHLMLVAHLPETGSRRIIRYALEHQSDGTVRQRPVNNVAVPGYPTDVGCAPVNVTRVIVENILMRQRRIDQISAARVKHAFRLTG